MAATQTNRAQKELTDLFNRVMTKAYRVENQPWDFGTGEPLTRSEIHFIVSVAECPLSTGSQLAARLGVTKGAVSQMLAKMEKKSYVRKLKGLDNDKEILLALTEKGERARLGHEQFHSEMFRHLFDGLTEGDILMLRNLMIGIESFVDGRLEEK